MLVVLLRVAIDNLCYFVYVSRSESAETPTVLRRHSRVTFRFILHALDEHVDADEDCGAHHVYDGVAACGRAPGR